MQLFRTFDEPQSSNIRLHPAFPHLSENEQKKVLDAYNTAFLNSQRLGIRVAEGQAYATASKLCEGMFQATRDAAPGTIADEADGGVVDSSISKPGPTYEAEIDEVHIGWDNMVKKLKGQGHSASSAAKIAGYIKKKKYGNGPVHEEEMTEAEISEAERIFATEMSSFFPRTQTGGKSKNYMMVNGEKHRVIGYRDGKPVTEPMFAGSGKTRHALPKSYTDTQPSLQKVQEGDAEEFQGRNDAMVGSNDALVGMTEVADENPEFDGSAGIQQQNVAMHCAACGATHPTDVVCYNGGRHSEVNHRTSGGAGDILKANHMRTGASLGMNVEENDPTIAAAARYLTHRAQVSGLMESLEEDAKDIQKKNLTEKCPGCGSLVKDGKCACTSGECKCGSNEDCACIDGKCKCSAGKCKGAGDIMKQNHAAKGMKDKAEGLDEGECTSGHTKFHTFSDGGRCTKCGAKKPSAPRPEKPEPEVHPMPGKPKFTKEEIEALAETDILIEELIDKLWEAHYYPASPEEAHCTSCFHPTSYHAVNECTICKGACEVMTEEKKHTLCFCGHEFGHHSKGGCKKCKREGYVSPGRAAHAFDKVDHSGDLAKQLESEYANIFTAQQGKISSDYFRAAQWWLPESEIVEGKQHGFDDIEHGDSVHYKTPQGQISHGRAHLYGGSAGDHWVLNTGRGMPSIVDRKNFVKVKKSGKAADPRKNFLVYGNLQGKKNVKEAELHEGDVHYQTEPGHPSKSSKSLPVCGAGWTLDHLPTNNKSKVTCGSCLKKINKKGIYAEATESENYGSVLTRHGYKHDANDQDGSYFRHPKTGHDVTINPNGSWSHKGKNKKMVSTTGEFPSSLHRHLSKVDSQQRSGVNRKERDDVMRSLGLNKVRGSVSGKTYWESEETPVTESELTEKSRFRSRSPFANPGGNSALRAASKANPRNLPCPTCHEENKLTPKDKRLGYQCDNCANREEGVGY